MTVAPAVGTVDLDEGAGWTELPAGLTPVQLHALGSATWLLAVRPSQQTRGRWEAKSVRKVGAVRLSSGDDTVRVRITPKIPVARLIYLLSYALNRTRWEPELVDATIGDGLFPAVAHCFIRMTERALAGGLPAEYRRVETTGTALRGRLNAHSQATRRPGRSLPLEMTYYERTQETPEARLLAAAVHRLSRIPDLEVSLAKRLARLAARLPAHTAWPVREKAPRPTRHVSAHLRPAVRLAGLVVDGRSFEYLHGQPDGAIHVDGVIVNMEHVFERFVSAVVRPALEQRLGGQTVFKPRTHFLDVRDKYPLLPDVVHLLPARATEREAQMEPAIIIDPKYQTHVRPDNLYQMLAYCTRFGLREAHLVTAGTDAVEPVTISTPAGAIVINRHTVDLSLPPLDLEARVRALADGFADARLPPADMSSCLPRSVAGPGEEEQHSAVGKQQFESD